MDGSLCALGGSAPNPVLTTIKYFRDEYLAHIVDKRCPAGVCKDLITYRIDPEICNGCAPVRQELSPGVHQRGEKEAPRHRRRSLHPLRHVPGRVPGGRGDRGVRR